MQKYSSNLDSCEVVYSSFFSSSSKRELIFSTVKKDYSAKTQLQARIHTSFHRSAEIGQIKLRMTQKRHKTNLTDKKI